MNELKYTEEQKRCLAQIGCMGYTLGNYLPQKCVWTIGKRETNEIIRRISKPWIDDILDITIIGVKDTKIVKGEKQTVWVPQVYVWIPSNSPHLQDQSLKDLDTGFKVPNNSSASDKLKEYGKRFSKTGDLVLSGGQQYTYDYENDRARTRNVNDRTGVVILLDRFIEIEFDARNHKYGEMFGNEFKRKTVINAIPQFKEVKGLLLYEKATIVKEIPETNNNEMDGTTIPRGAINLR